jgi:hypothetical protein
MRNRMDLLKRIAPGAILAAALAAGATALGVSSTALGAPSRQQAAAIDVTQTCPRRVNPGATIAVEITLANTGDVVLGNIDITADAGTPLTTGDDFVPAFQSGDADGDGFLDPGERWAYGGSYRAADEDVTNIVAVEAFGPADEVVNDEASCETDVVQPPEPGVRVGVREVRGKVLFRRPGESKFVELEGVTEIPVGSQVDTRRGAINLTIGLGGGRTNSSQFYDGLFTMLQTRARNAFMNLRLDGGNFGVCGRRSLSTLGVEARRKRPVRKLWGSGKGRFSSRGRYSSATVRGTKWLVQDRCDGTLTRVVSGRVQVRDFRLRKTITVRAGRSYLARAPG